MTEESIFPKKSPKNRVFDQIKFHKITVSDKDPEKPPDAMFVVNFTTMEAFLLVAKSALTCP